jgi:phage baseplate assembly protein W
MKRSGGARHNTVAVGDLPPTPTIKSYKANPYEGPGYDRDIQERDSKKAENRFNVDNAGSLKLTEEYRRKQKEAEDARNKIKVKVGEAPSQNTNVGKSKVPIYDDLEEMVVGIGGGPRLRSFTRKLKKCFGMSCMNTSTVAPAEEEMITPSGSRASGSRASGSRVAPMPQDIVNAALKEAKSVKTRQQEAMAEFEERNADVERIGSKLERRDSPRTKAALKAELAALGTASPPRSRSRTKRTVVSRSAGPMTTKLGKLSLVDIAELKNIQEFPVKELIQYAETYKTQIEDDDDVKKAIEELMESIKNTNTKRRQYGEGTNKRKQFNSMLKNLIESLRTLIATNFINTHKISA